MVMKRSKFEVIENPLSILQRRFEDAEIVFYPAGEVPEGSQPIAYFLVAEKLLEADSVVRESYDVPFGPEGWAATPTTNKDGETIDGLVDVVTTVNQKRMDRLRVSDETPKVGEQQARDLARPALYVVKDEPGTVD